MFQPRWARLVLCSLFLLKIGWAAPSYITFPSDIPWVTRESAHFEIIYRSGQTSFAERVLGYAERAHEMLDKIFPEGPEKTFIVLADFQDSVNGYALNFPYPHFVLFASPPSASNQLSSLENWLFSLVLHEYTHIRHLYPANGLWSFARSIFGSVIMPNGLMPSHFHEGLATLMETELTQGGRGRSAFFKMLQRKAVESNAWGESFSPIDQMDGAASLFPQGTSSYFFGYQLYDELWKRKGAKGIHDFTNAQSRNIAYMLHRPLHAAYGEDLSFETLWADIFNKRKLESQKELEEIKAKPLSPLKYITRSQQNKWDLTRSPDGKWVAYRSYTPRYGSQIRLLNGNTLGEFPSVENEISHAEGMCFLPAGNSNWLVYVKPQSENMYNTFTLVAFDPATRKRVTLKSDDFPLEHIHQIGCAKNSTTLMVYRERAGDGQVAELNWDPTKDAATTKLTLKRKWSVPTGHWVTSLLPGPRSWLLTRADTNAQLLSWGTEGDPKAVWKLPGHAYALRPAGEGNLFAIGEWEGRSEVWLLDPQNKLATKKVAVTGGISSFDVVGTSFLVTSYEQGGYDVARAQAIPAVAETPREPAQYPVRSASAETTLSAERGYSAWKTVLPRSWIPSLLFVPSGAQFGVWLPAFDLAQRHIYNIYGGYDTRGLPFADLDYMYRFGKSTQVGARAYYVPSFILSQNAFLKQWGATVSLTGKLFNLPPWLTFNVIFKRIETSPLGGGMQSGGIGVDVSHSFGFERKPLAITPRWGTRIGISHAFYPAFLGSTDQYFASTVAFEQNLPSPLAWDHGFFLASRLGYTEGTRRYNSYYQGGGEILFAQQRGYFLNRGFAPGSFFSRRIFNQNVEYRFPIARIERGIHYAPFNLRVLHAALVADCTTSDFGVQLGNVPDLFKNFYYSAGIELKSEWNFFFYFPSQVRFGLYRGFGNPGIGRVPERIYFSMGLESYL